MGKITTDFGYLVIDNLYGHFVSDTLYAEFWLSFSVVNFSKLGNTNVT